MKNSRLLLLGAILSGMAFPSFAQIVDPIPALTIRPVPPESVRLSWGGAFAGFMLEETGAHTSTTLWEAVRATPSLAGGEFSLTLANSPSVRFYRLRERGMTRVADTSPSPL